MPKFNVSLHFMQFSRAEVIIEAKSLAEAEANAELITADQVDDWNPYDGEIEVQSVTRVRPINNPPSTINKK